MDKLHLKELGQTDDVSTKINNFEVLDETFLVNFKHCACT